MRDREFKNKPLNILEGILLFFFFTPEKWIRVIWIVRKKKISNACWIFWLTGGARGRFITWRMERILFGQNDERSFVRSLWRMNLNFVWFRSFLLWKRLRCDRTVSGINMFMIWSYTVVMNCQRATLLDSAVKSNWFWFVFWFRSCRNLSIQFDLMLIGSLVRRHFVIKSWSTGIGAVARQEEQRKKP